MTHEILGVIVDDVTDQELEERLLAFLHSDRPHRIVTPNPEMVLLARKDPAFREQLNLSDLRLPDGIGLQVVTRRLRHRHTGVDTLEMIARLCAEQGKQLVLLGGEFGEGEVAAEQLKKRYQGIRVVAMDPGKISADGSLSPEVRQVISDLHPDVIAVAFGQKKQEAAMALLAEAIPHVRILIGVGGAFNMISGRLRRAPSWMRRVGLEWLWRVLIEPSRFPRTMRATVVFPLTVFWAKVVSR